MGLAYRWEGQKNFKLRGADGGMICEFLGLGNQMVMPPSIHPDCAACGNKNVAGSNRSEEHTSELQSLMRISYAVFCLTNNKYDTNNKFTHLLHIPNSTEHPYNR